MINWLKSERYGKAENKKPMSSQAVIAVRYILLNIQG